MNILEIANELIKRFLNPTFNHFIFITHDISTLVQKILNFYANIIRVRMHIYSYKYFIFNMRVCELLFTTIGNYIQYVYL